MLRIYQPLGELSKIKDFGGLTSEATMDHGNCSGLGSNVLPEPTQVRRLS